MNIPELYERRLDREGPVPVSTPEPEKAVSALAVHRDPSLPPTAPQAAIDRTRPSVAWVRPSEVPGVLGARWVGRGIDLQAELARRARRTPGAAAAQVARRVTRTAIAQPEQAGPTVTTEAGLGL